MKYIIGLHAVEIWLRKVPKGAVLLVAKENKRNAALRRQAVKSGITVENVNHETISKHTGTEDHKGIALGIPAGRGMDDRDLKPFLTSLGDNALLVLMDEVTDPRNLGAVLRSAEQFSADGVFLPKKRSAGITSAVSKTSAGADAIVPLITVVNISRTVELIKEYGFWVYGADMSGTPVNSADLTGKVAFVLGSEGKGLATNIKNHCDGLISIPTTGILDSLNVSVAAGIFLYEIRRQQRTLPEG